MLIGIAQGEVNMWSTNYIWYISGVFIILCLGFRVNRDYIEVINIMLKRDIYESYFW